MNRKCILITSFILLFVKIIQDDEYPDVEMGGEQHNPVPAPRLPRRATDNRERKDEYEGLMSFILQCLPPALSVIMVDCKYDRANLLRRILEHNTGNSAKQLSTVASVIMYLLLCLRIQREQIACPGFFL